MASPRSEFYAATLQIEDIIKTKTDSNGKVKRDFLDPIFYKKIQKHLKNATLETTKHDSQETPLAALTAVKTAFTAPTSHSHIAYTVPATLECRVIDDNHLEIYRIIFQHTDKSVTTLVFPQPISITLASNLKKESDFLPAMRQIREVDAEESIISLEEFLTFKQDINDLFTSISNDQVREILLSESISDADKALITTLDQESSSTKYTNLLALYEKINLFSGTANISYSDYKAEVKDLLEEIKRNSQSKKFFNFLGFKSNVEIKTDEILTKHFSDTRDNALRATSSTHRG